MDRYLISLLFVLFFHLGLAIAHAQTPSASWSTDEMNPLPPKAAKSDEKIRAISCGDGCKFDLHYFRGRNVPDGKNILFISGGPGHIENRSNRFLEFLEDEYNVFYFDIRGAGFSAIAQENKFDTALRAKHVVGDLERIRTKELGANATWDAVYGHSHGTIVAQLYAKSSASGIPRLDKLILSAPLSRVTDFEKDRIEMLAKNLKSIFENYRQTDGEKCPSGAPPPPGDLNGTDNFCFLGNENDGMVQHLVNKLKRNLTDLSEAFGSFAFVTEFFDKIEAEDPDTLKQLSPYPKEFYLALQRLSLFGGTEPGSLMPSDRVREIRVNSAFLLGYYLALKEEDFQPDAVFNPLNGCQPAARFFDGVSNSAQTEWKTAFCRRFFPARRFLLAAEKNERAVRSTRANIVYGLNDGMHRFLFNILNEPSATCLNSAAVRNFANTNANSHKAVRALIRRIGIDLAEPICLWNPGGPNAHGIPTLILKGGSDPLISGCQAEAVFKNGLTGDRVLFEFPGVGHLMQLPGFVTNGVKTDGGEALLKLVDTFLTKSFEEFRNDTSVNKLKERLHATMHAATGPASNNICED